MRHLGDADTGVYSFTSEICCGGVQIETCTARWVVGGEECSGTRCCKPEWMSYQSMILVCESDETAEGLICCEGFSDSTIVTRNQMDGLAVLFA